MVKDPAEANKLQVTSDYLRERNCCQKSWIVSIQQKLTNCR